MSRPVLIDYFCKAGGAAMGYHRAGFEVIGVDIEPQPHYPFTFIQADVFEVFSELAALADVIHGSPPCQDHSRMRSITGRDSGTGWMLGEFLRLCRETGKPYVVENVIGSPITGTVLCGTMFDLKVKRHRVFSTSFDVSPIACGSHDGEFYSPTGHGDPNRRNRSANPHLKGAGYTYRCRQAMGIDWMNRDELAQAIPPAYTEYIGRHLLATIEGRAA